MISSAEVERQLRVLALSVKSLQDRMANVSRETRDWEFSGNFTPPQRNDSTRGDAGVAGRVIFNTDDGNLNVDDGSDWVAVGSGLAAAVGGDYNIDGGASDSVYTPAQSIDGGDST